MSKDYFVNKLNVTFFNSSLLALFKCNTYIVAFSLFFIPRFFSEKLNNIVNMLLLVVPKTLSLVVFRLIFICF